MKLFALGVVLLLAAVAVAEEASEGEPEVVQTVKDTVFYEDYFRITLTKPNITRGYEGWANYTLHVTCRNGTSEGDFIFPYEEVAYVLGVKSTGGLVESIAKGKLIYLPGACDMRTVGRYYVTRKVTNLTLIHLIKPEHSRVSAKEVDVHTLNEIPSPDRLIQFKIMMEKFLDNQWVVLAVAFGTTLILLSLILNMMLLNKIYSFFTFIIGFILLILGLVMGVI